MDAADDRQKIWEIIKDCRFAMLVTIEGDGALRARPMTTVQNDFDGELWFFAEAHSPAVTAIANHPEVCVAYAHSKNADFVSISGTAAIEREAARKQKLWNPMVQAWFPQGPDSSEVVLIRVAAQRAEYWDSASNKLVQIYSMAAALMRGTQPQRLGEHREVVL